MDDGPQGAMAEACLPRVRERIRLLGGAGRLADLAPSLAAASHG